MAKYRQIHTKIWSSPDFQDLSVEGKFVFIYLFSNSHRNEAALYRITPKTVSNETDVPIEKVREALKELTEQELIKWDPDANIVWVINAIKYQKLSPNEIKGIQNDLASIDHPFIQELIAYYKETFSTYEVPSKELPSTSKVPSGKGKGKGKDKGKGNINIPCDDVTEPEETGKENSVSKGQKKKTKFSEEGREITKYLQEKLKNAGVDHFPRDWLLKNYATADRLLKTIPKLELKECIAWAMADLFWKNTINDLLGVEKAYMQFKRKGAKANGQRSPSLSGQDKRELYSEEDRENAAAWKW